MHVTSENNTRNILVRKQDIEGYIYRNILFVTYIMC